MIKINLLDSVTERQSGKVASSEKKAANPMTRIMLMGIAVLGLTFAVIGWDFISSSMAKSEAERQLAEEKEKGKELEAVKKEQEELETKIKNIDKRIEAIKKLRNSQAGPSAVLESIRERIKTTPDIYLDSVDQKGDQLTIKGSSPTENPITQFGRSLEFSSGLFSNLTIETQRKEIEKQEINEVTGVIGKPALEIVEFTIRCAYTPEKANKEGTTTASNDSDAQNQADSEKKEPAKTAKN